MGGLLQGITGTSGSQSQQTTDTSSREVQGRQKQAYDVLMRSFLGQLVRPPETAISVPQQQAISQLQQSAGGGSASLADRLAGNAPSVAAPTGTSYAPTSQTGLPQAGLQTREQLGLPKREDYFTFVPSAEEIAAIGLAPIRGGTPAITKASKQQEKLEARIEKRKEAGKGTAKAEKKLENVKKKRASETGESYL